MSSKIITVFAASSIVYIVAVHYLCDVTSRIVASIRTSAIIIILSFSFQLNLRTSNTKLASYWSEKHHHHHHTTQHTNTITRPPNQQRNREFERRQISSISDFDQPPPFTPRSIASLWTTESSEEILIALNSNTSPPILQCAISQQIFESNQVEK